jgi:HEAT repeat protein
MFDLDPDVRAVAAISLARADVSDDATVRHILRMLSDQDRLVREAACMALGVLKVKEALPKLTYLW